jgi:hypothetical protein
MATSPLLANSEAINMPSFIAPISFIINGLDMPYDAVLVRFFGHSAKSVRNFGQLNARSPRKFIPSPFS